MGQIAIYDKVERSQASSILVPFLKWAGGKRWFTTDHAHLLPTDFDRYVEPFLGSGAVYFHLQPNAALLADSNTELINTYSEIRSNWNMVQRALRKHNRNHDEDYYYLERSRRHRVGHERAAQFIYLNRVCWNGLYRVNLKGEFNVPLGTKTSVILPTDDFARMSNALEGAELRSSDFEPILSEAGSSDFVFVDPPYVTRHNLNGFVKYNDKIFLWKDQLRLRDSVASAAKRGAKILVTNADHESVKALYRKLGKQTVLRRQSVLAADPTNRGTTTEIAVQINYE